jgi:hypothetical protein
MTRFSVGFVSAAVLGAATLFVAGCGPLSNTEGSHMIVIDGSALQAGPQPGAIRLVINDGVADQVDEIYNDLNGWPSDPVRHSVLVIADVGSPHGEKSFTVTASACTDASCASLLGFETTSVTFRGGVKGNDVLMNIVP